MTEEVSPAWRALQKARVMVRTGIDPDRYMFVTAPDEKDVLENGLRARFGVVVGELYLFDIHESAAVDPGLILVFDREKIESPLIPADEVGRIATRLIESAITADHREMLDRLVSEELKKDLEADST